MTITVARFEDMAWETGTHDLERKKSVPDRSVVLIEFAPGFEDPSWCERSHALYVLRGALELEMNGGSTVIGAGQCAVLDRGTRHRARNPGVQHAVAFIVSDVDLAEPRSR
jgi:quercetin dioxygenase-like cupin family protein